MRSESAPQAPKCWKAGMRGCCSMELENQSRVVCLPCREDTIRGYGNVSLLVIDEAARVTCKAVVG